MNTSQNSTSEHIYRQYTEKDAVGVKQCLLVLQNFVNNLEPQLMAKGEDVYDSYFEFLVNEVAKKNGKIFVAESNNEIVGFIAFYFTKDEYESSKALYISDLVVLEKFRGLGVGSNLLKFADEHAKQQGTKFVKIGALAKNHNAIDLYRKKGFVDYAVTLLKIL